MLASTYNCPRRQINDPDHPITQGIEAYADELIQLRGARPYQLQHDDVRIAAAGAACAFGVMHGMEEEVKSRDAFEAIKQNAYGFAALSAFPPAKMIGLEDDKQFVNRSEAGCSREKIAPEQYDKLKKGFTPLLPVLQYE